MKISTLTKIFLTPAEFRSFNGSRVKITSCMQIFTSKSTLEWGELDLPLLGIAKDWYGAPLAPPVGFALAADQKKLWFISTRQAPATPLPGSEPGSFVAGLWGWDVAELFLAAPDGKQYIEFNIAPNGAWWARKFQAPREPAEVQPDFATQMTIRCEEPDAQSWMIAVEIPLNFLQREIEYGPGSRANVAFILNSPSRTFHSAANLPGSDPDFHQPSSFPLLIPCNFRVSPINDDTGEG